MSHQRTARRPTTGASVDGTTFRVLVAAALLVAVALGGMGGCRPAGRQGAGDGATSTPSAETTPGETTPIPDPEGEPSIPATPSTPPTEQPVVVIDAGHQGKADPTPEPIGPGASETKPGVSTGAQGRVSRVPESVVTLQVAKRLRDELQRRGVKVVMVREDQNAQLTNSERATIANNAKADLFIRLHADGSPDTSLRGISTLVPAPNQWTRPIVAESAKAGGIVQRAVVSATGAPDLGVKPRTDITGFNWSQVPTVLVEMGFMSNADEDRLLNSPEYQEKLATGMADGVVQYVRGR